MTSSWKALQCPVVTIRCYPWSVRSWQVFQTVGMCVFSHQSADYRIVVAHLASNSFEGHPCCRSDRPRVTSDRDDRALQRLVRRMSFATSPVLKQYRLLLTRTVRNRLKSVGLQSRRVTKRPLLVDQHRRGCRNGVQQLVGRRL
jgi:hypothetical protein